MKFNAATSKLYQQIMDGLTSFFGLDSENASETDIHAALDSAKPLSEQLDAAKTAAIADLKGQFDTMKSEFDANKTVLTELQEQFKTMKSENETKDVRIAELQNDAAKAKLDMDAMKAQHKTETERLAGELAQAKAGKSMELDESGEAHTAGALDKSTGAKLITVKSDSLKNLVKPAQK